ncbi:MAG: hypothetical protein HY784_04350 [Chloroflexi bacterium]|nr:hypothetical protein [Chloroflexota bacterium]
MKEKVLIQLLDEQAAQLQRDLDPTGEMVEVFGREALVGELLALGRRLRLALPSLEPPAAFVSELKAGLLRRLPASGVRVPALRPPERLRLALPADPHERRLLFGVAGLGALAYLAGIALFSMRVLLYVLSLTGLVVGLHKSGLLRPGIRRRPG